MPAYTANNNNKNCSTWLAWSQIHTTNYKYMPFEYIFMYVSRSPYKRESERERQRKKKATKLYLLASIMLVEHSAVVILKEKNTHTDTNTQMQTETRSTNIQYILSNWLERRILSLSLLLLLSFSLYVEIDDESSQHLGLFIEWRTSTYEHTFMYLFITSSLVVNSIREILMAFFPSRCFSFDY